MDLGFIVHNVETGVKDTPNDLKLDLTQFNEAWIITGDPTVYTTQPTAAQLLSASFGKLQAFWISRTTVAIQQQFVQPGGTYFLTGDPTASLQLTTAGVQGGISLPLTTGNGFTPDELNRFPQLSTYAVLHLPANADLQQLKTMLTGQLAFSAIGSDGTLKYATSVQDAGVLDDLFFYSGKLGVVTRGSDNGNSWNDWADDDPGYVKVKVWAPTAQSMSLRLYDHQLDSAPSKTVAMHKHNGVWVATFGADALGKYYLLDERVYAPSVRKIVENIVTDPYSVDLALNGIKSRLTDVDSDSTKPDGWDEDRAPQLASKNDLTLYELHVRDFSANDASVPAAYRGTYLAFTDQHTNGMRHLHELAESGLKAVHLLPTFHLASINEDKTTWKTTPDLSVYAPDSQQQQAAVAAIQSSDAFNWGYDPLHYLAPEGGYAYNPDQRVREYRSMVMGLHNAGLRVVQDVVFNHTSGFGENPNSVLDQVVPDYYNRLDADGNLETGSCCADTATEHKMMAKLQQDAVVFNAKKYKIDGFRFDLMSFTFVPNMQAIQNALSKLTLRDNGIDGSKIYLYGEGFNFGETADNALGVNASQLNLYGNGIGTFNDRIRDGIRGGSPFTDERVQGFATGLFTDSSTFTAQSISDPADQKAALLKYSDWILVGLTGNLRDYSFINSVGATVTGAQVDYNGQPTGYTATPLESINYCSVHDNQTLFDAVQLKSALTDSAATRARRQVLSMSMIALGQGVPFFLAGDDLLRSKDMDQNSYDSGDWFNKLDFTYQTNNWGTGLPIASQNQSQWTIQQPLLADSALRPTPDDIGHTRDAFREFLSIRASSGLFRMHTFQEVQNNLHFLNVGPNQVPGMIAMQLDSNNGQYGNYRHIIVVFNATNQQQTLQSTTFAGSNFHLHPIQRSSRDSIVRQSSFDKKAGSVTVPALTTAVFVSEQ
jgi:pullulanase